MNAPSSQVLSRISKIVLAGIGLAFAWLVLSFTLGLTSSYAHADDDTDLLDGLGSALSGATSGVTEIVGGTATTVAQTLAPVLPSIPAAAPVVKPVVTTAVTTVTDVAASGAASQIVDAAADTVATIPIVGDASAALGLDEALASVGATVDTALAETTAAAADAVAGILGTATGIVPGIPPLGSADDDVAPSAGTAGPDAVPQPLEVLARASLLSGATAWAIVTNTAPSGAGSEATAAAAGLGALTFFRAVLQADSVFTGPGGAGPGVWVLVALGPVVAYRGWMRRSGSENDVVPAAPVLSTDVSPD